MFLDWLDIKVLKKIKIKFLRKSYVFYINIVRYSKDFYFTHNYLNDLLRIQRYTYFFVTE